MSNAYEPVPLQFQRRSEAEMRARVSEFYDEIAARRTVRHYSTEPIPLDVVERAIAAAATAPSGANQQPWTFVMVTDPEIKRRLREAAEAEERESYQHRMSQEWLDALGPLGTDWHKAHITDAPCVIVVFSQPYGVRAEPDGTPRRVKHYYVEESVGIAVGLLLTALHRAGLATLTHTPSPMNFLRTLLGRPANERAYVLIPVGYPAVGAEVPNIARKKLDEVLVRR